MSPADTNVRKDHFEDHDAAHERKHENDAMNILIGDVCFEQTACDHWVEYGQDRSQKCHGHIKCEKPFMRFIIFYETFKHTVFLQ